jgi:formate hydrogenlyase subunit 3/multisubunit Na+/H+ antiporter MnhD subunit
MTALFFAVVGMVYDKYTPGYSKTGGFASVMPWAMVGFTIAGLFLWECLVFPGLWQSFPFYGGMAN